MLHKPFLRVGVNARQCECYSFGDTRIRSLNWSWCSLTWLDVVSEAIDLVFRRCVDYTSDTYQGIVQRKPSFELRELVAQYMDERCTEGVARSKDLGAAPVVLKEMTTTNSKTAITSPTQGAQYFSRAALSSEGSLKCPCFPDCQDAIPTPPSYSLESPGSRLNERMG
jgi:hypothetical protein